MVSSKRPTSTSPFAYGKFIRHSTTISRICQLILFLFQIRINCVIIGTAALSYVLQPLINGNRETPAVISINGVTYWPLHIFLAIYAGQVLYAFCVFFILCAYDVIFIQCVLTMSYRFRTMCEILKLLNYSGPRLDEKDKQIIVDVYLMHLSVLRYVYMPIAND